ncbi:MAG: agmatine deiminase family protein [Pirellulaceae bacterium]|nr:agmatine deiminase family protein [Pirellulaceae bacterium]
MISSDKTPPAELGFRMPAEWHPHEATWLAWPHNRQTWPENLPAAQQEFVRLVETISKGETVCVIATGEALAQAEAALQHIKHLQLFDISTNDAWIRDYGPTFVIQPESASVAGINWRYNAWGEKYPPFEDDVRAAENICRAAGTNMFSTPYVVEGGALEINDQGDLLTTISCLLNFNRNPILRDGQVVPLEEPISELEFSNHQANLSRVLAAMTGATSITWLSGAEMLGDDTNGHIDQQVRFADSECVILAKGYAPQDPLQSNLAVIIEELKSTFGAQHRQLQGMDLPLPPPIELHGRQIPASYLNFYICNYGVVVPQFDSPLADARAIDLLTAAFPGRRVIGLPSLNLACGLGSFHCLTQQQPAL